MKSNGTTVVIFIVRQMQENFRVKGKWLCGYGKKLLIVF